MKKILIFILISLFFSCNQGTKRTYKKTNSWLYVKDGKTYPLDKEFKEIINLPDLKGKVILVDFWASWCKPCRKANKKLTRLYKKYHSENFEILGVSLDGVINPKNPQQDWLRAIEKDSLIWKNVSELKGWGSEVVELYNIHSIPHTILIDKQGNIVVEKLLGDELEKEIEKLLNGKSN